MATSASAVGPLALLFSATALVLSPVLSADFIRLDDHSHLFDNPHLQRMSVAGLAAIWTKSYFNLYIPITYSVWWAATMVGSLFGPLRHNAWLFHALNLVIHLANAAVVFFLVQRLLSAVRSRATTPDAGPLNAGQGPDGDEPEPNPPGREAAQPGATGGQGAKQKDVGHVAVALVSALFFAIHPVQVETVAWVSEMRGELAALFGFLGLWWHCGSSRRVLTAGCFVAAMLAKPSAIVFPGIALLLDWVVLGSSLSKSALMSALYGLLLLPLLFVTKQLQPDANLDFIPTAMQRLAVAADALAFYLGKVLVPYPLALDYGRTPRYVLSHISGWTMTLSALLVVATTAAAAWSRFGLDPSSPDRPWFSLVACGWSIFLFSLAPVLGFIPFGFQDISTVADHYLYVPLMGVGLVVAGVLIHLRDLARTYHVAVTVLVVMASLSFQQARLWRSTESLFTHTLAVNPRSYMASYCIAQEYMQARRWAQSIEWLDRSLAANPNYLNAHIALGLVWANQGQLSRAIAHYRSVLANNPSAVGNRARPVASIHNNLGLLLLHIGHEAEAVEQFRRAVQIFPRAVNAHVNLGNVAFRRGRFADAIAEYDIALSLVPGDRAIEQRRERARAYARSRPFSD